MYVINVRNIWSCQIWSSSLYKATCPRREWTLETASKRHEISFTIQKTYLFRTKEYYISGCWSPWWSSSGPRGSPSTSSTSLETSPTYVRIDCIARVADPSKADPDPTRQDNLELIRQNYPLNSNIKVNFIKILKLYYIVAYL